MSAIMFEYSFHFLLKFFSLVFPASAYQDEDSKRHIMRLEQCARSSMQRDLASKGALAVLYGRHVKEYIKKTEVCFSNLKVLIRNHTSPLQTLLQPLPTLQVILGRATEDNEVDIDLGKEGLHNKISRRQVRIVLFS